MFDIIILIVCAIGTICSATNATRAESVGGMLLWDCYRRNRVSRNYSKSYADFYLTFPINYAIIYT